MNASLWIRTGLSIFVAMVAIVYVVTHRDEETALMRQGAAELVKKRMGEVVAPVLPPADTEESSAAPARRQVAEAPVFSGMSVENLAGELAKSLTPEFLATFTKGRGETADNLVLAADLTKDTSYLYRAASLFPESPAVQLRLARLDGTPGDFAAVLVALRKGAPDNALVDYLSAARHFGNGENAAGLEDVRQGNRKREITDYSASLSQSAEDAYVNIGYPEAQAKLAAHFINAVAIQTAILKTCSAGLLALQKAAAQEGNQAAVADISREGVAMCHLVKDQARSSTISALVNNDEGRFLMALPGDSEVPGLAQTVDARFEALALWKAEFNQATEGNDERLHQLSDSELLEYAEVEKRSGDLAAMRWLRDRR